MKELSIYIHIPFCVQKCFYCDFLSFGNRNDIFENYINALVNEIKNYKEECKDYIVKTIFIGGGTPSCLESEHIKRVCEAVFENYNICKNAEITIESNPGTLDYEKLNSYYKLGINRLSMGLQSADDKMLKRIGRIHSFSDFKNNFILAREVGFSNINVDIMSSLPEQDMNNLIETHEKVTDFSPEHISAYSLIIEDGTKIKKMYDEGIYTPIDDDLDREMYYKTKEILKSKGYNRYEISNYAKDGFECKHNIVYWECREYLGFGLAAHSDFKGKRFNNILDIEKYISKNGINIRENIIDYSKKDRESEFMFMGLRMTKGVSDKAFKNRFKESIFDIYRDEIKELSLENLIEITGNDTIKLTDRGIDISNTVFLKFL